LNPKVSVVIPAYNTERYITRAIESVLGQTERDVEVIVVDDASTDATVDMIKNLSDERLKLFVNERNQGPGYTRNRALKESRGEWIALLDSDDWYAPERLEELLRVAMAENADLVADDLAFIQDGAEHPWSTLFSLSGERLEGLRHVGAAEYVESNMPERRCLRLGLTKPLIKRSFLVRYNLGYNQGVRYGQDFLFYLDCLLNGARFVVVPKPYYFYRRRQGSLVTERKLDRLDSYRRENLRLLQQEPVRNNPKLARALSKRLRRIEQNTIYYRIVEPLKEGNLARTLAEIVRNPRFFVLFAARVPLILCYRITRRFGKVRGT
jgi:succinoglycan biosynthesis protein ExoO